LTSRFIADNNVAKLARLLRMIGYDTLLLRQKDDNELIETAINEDRVIVTKDAQFMKRRVVVSGRVGAMLISKDSPAQQLREVVGTLHLDYHHDPFSRCLECNQPVVPRRREEVQDLVPPHVLSVQEEFTQCPACRRVYWKGTHWQAMSNRLREWHADDNAGGAASGDRCS
jgi:uncharacterized protein